MSLFSIEPEQAKRPALTLARVHLRSVGPNAARFDPLDIRHDSAAGVADKVLWSLTNTGGKTTMIRLLSSVVVTAARDQVGGAQIGEYVQSGDTAHVVTEWDHAGTRFVLGGVYEWPGRTRPVDLRGDLTREWYTFRVGDIGIDDLPFDVVADDGTKRRRTLADFRAQMTELFANRGADQFVWARRQTDWANALDKQTPIDPELFRYQMRMNDEESGAGALIKQLSSPELIVLFFIQVLNDDAALANFTETLSNYATLAGNRSNLENELEFFTELAEGLTTLDDAERARAAAELEVLTARRDGNDLAASIRVRAAGEEQRIAATSEDLRQVDAENEQVRAAEYRHENQRAQLNLEEARLLQRDAEVRLAHAEAQLEAATRTMRAWQAVEPFQAWRNATAAADAAIEIYDRAEQGLRPLRLATQSAGANVAAKYAALADAGAKVAEEALRVRDAAKRAADDAERAGRDLDRKHHSLEQELAQVDGLISTGRAVARTLLANGVAHEGEEPYDTEARLRRAVEATREQQRQVRERSRELARLIDEFVRPIRDARRHVSDAEARARDARRRRDSFVGERDVLAAEPTVASLAGDAKMSGPDEAGRLAQLAADYSAANEQDASTTEEQVRTLEAEIARFEAGDLMATAPEIEATVELLRNAGVGATTGWEWISHNIPADEREVLIEVRPDLANAVIVTDRTRLAHARELCDTEALAHRIAVLVADPGEFANIDRMVSDDGFVLTPHRALYDPEWTAQALEEMRVERDQLAAVASDLRSSANLHRAASSTLKIFATRWDGVTLDDLERDTAAAFSSREQADASLAELTEQQATLQAERDGIGEELDRLGAQLTEQTGQLGEAARALVTYNEGRSAEDRRASVQAQLNRTAAARSELDEKRVAAALRRDEAAERAAEAKVESGNYRKLQADTGVEPSGQAPDEPLPELESRWKELRARLRAEEQGSDHAERRDAAQQNAADKRAVVDAMDPAIVEIADQLCQTFEASNPGLRSESVRNASRTYESTTEVRARAKTAVEAAEREAANRAPANGLVHIALPDDWDVSTIDSISDYRETLDTQLLAERELGRRLTQRSDTLKAEIVRSRKGHEQFTVAAKLWINGPSDLDGAYAEFVGSGEDAIEQLTTSRARLDAAVALHEERSVVLRAADNVVRNVARDERWAAVASPIRERCKTAPPAEIAASAAPWLRDVGIRRKSLADDLATLDRHRDILVAVLEQLCSAQRRLLNEVTACSKLPQSLGGDLAGQPAFKILFDKLSDTEARGRLIARVDDWATRLVADGKTRSLSRDERVRWLAEAVRDTVKSGQSGAWRVTVLKPPVDGTVEYRTPDRVAKEYSGGQELTLAVLLYCTLAAVRAKHRTGGARPPGVLLIDNPFGRASNPALIRMQQLLAIQSGVQLVCATGLDDPGVLSAFEGDTGRVVRLRNDRDQRRGLMYLRIADSAAAAAVTEAFGGNRTDGTDEARVSASSYTVRTNRGQP